MTVYGLQADVSANPNSNVVLYIPGKTVLTPQDVFLGGPDTGVTDAMLGQSTRVYGQDRSKTSLALKNYTQDLSSQIKAAQATNAAPRVDSDKGTATMSRQAMEIGQAQNAVSNDLAQNTFDHGVAQDAFTNEYNVGNMMGNYKGKSTMAQTQNMVNNGIAVGDLMGTYGGKATLGQRSQSIQDAQYNARLSQEESQFGRELASGNYNSSQNRLIDQQNANTNAAKATAGDNPTQSDIVAAATGQAQDYLNLWASGLARDDSGNLKPRATSDEIQQWVRDNAGELTASKVNVSTFGKWAKDTFVWNP